MPLKKGNTKTAIADNIKELEGKGKRPHKQAVAIALHTAKDAKPKPKKRGSRK